MVLKAYTDEEFLDIFLSDNMKEDGQSTGWALGSVRKVVPYLMAETGITKSEAHAILADKIGLQPHEIQKLTDMNAALDAGILSPSVKRLLSPHNAVEFWKKLQELLTIRLMDEAEQARHIDYIIAGPDQRRRVTNTFSKLIQEAQAANPQAVTPKPPKQKVTPAIEALRALDKAAAAFRRGQAEDFEYDEQDILLIADKMKYLASVAPTIDLTDLTELIDSRQAITEVLAEMANEETENGVRSSEIQQTL